MLGASDTRSLQPPVSLLASRPPCTRLAITPCDAYVYIVMVAPTASSWIAARTLAASSRSCAYIDPMGGWGVARVTRGSPSSIRTASKLGRRDTALRWIPHAPAPTHAIHPTPPRPPSPRANDDRKESRLFKHLTSLFRAIERPRLASARPNAAAQLAIAR